MTATRRHLGNGAAPTLEQQVAAALADDNIAADKLEALIEQVEHGIRAAEAGRRPPARASHGPGAQSRSLRDARQRLEDSIFLVGRLKTLRPRLERQLAEVLDAEQHARWLADYEAVKVKRDEAVEAFNKYPELVADLLDILHTARDVDAECARVNRHAPSGEQRRLLRVELTARELPAYNIEFPSISDRIALAGSPERPSHALATAADQSGAVRKIRSYDPRFSDAWGALATPLNKSRREQAEREREQFEHDAEVAQSDGGRIPVWWLKGGNGNAAE